MLLIERGRLLPSERNWINGPLANVTFINGSWDGGIYARSLTGNGEGHINPVPDRDVCQ